MLYRSSHKTGIYGVSVKEETGDQILVQIEQVIKHPKQGDLHHPNETEGIFLHKRKVLDHFRERCATPSQLRESNVEAMPYGDPFQRAITHLENQLKKEKTEYPRLSLNNLSHLKEDYAIRHKRHFG